MTTKISSVDEVMLINLNDFFKNKKNVDIMVSIITGECDISLRVLDWFVTNYSKKERVNYTIVRNGDKKTFDVYLNYKSQLKGFNKRNFDPFCRTHGNKTKKIKFPLDDKRYIETTIGQLNFFKWAIEKHIIDYIKLNNNLEKINNDMNKCNMERKRKKKEEKMKKKLKIKNKEIKLKARKTETNKDIKILFRIE